MDYLIFSEYMLSVRSYRGLQNKIVFFMIKLLYFNEKLYKNGPLSNFDADPLSLITMN